MTAFQTVLGLPETIGVIHEANGAISRVRIGEVLYDVIMPDLPSERQTLWPGESEHEFTRTLTPKLVVCSARNCFNIAEKHYCESHTSLR